MRSDTRRNEATALGNAQREGEEQERRKWEDVIVEKDTATAGQATCITEHSTCITEQAKRIAELEALLN